MLLVIYIFLDIYSCCGLLGNVVGIRLTIYGCIFCHLLQGIESFFSPIATRFKADAITTLCIYIYTYIYTIYTCMYIYTVLAILFKSIQY